MGLTGMKEEKVREGRVGLEEKGGRKDGTERDEGGKRVVLEGREGKRWKGRTKWRGREERWDWKG